MADKLQETSTDLLIIGSGPAGYVAALYAAKNGLDVMLVEKSKLGGTCLNIGCIPTKTLVESSKVSNMMKNAEEFGVKIDGDISTNMEDVIKRKVSITQRLVSGIEFLMKKNKIKVIYGQASFINENTIKVEGASNYKIKAKDIIIATVLRYLK